MIVSRLQELVGLLWPVSVCLSVLLFSPRGLTGGENVVRAHTRYCAALRFKNGPNYL